MMRQDTFKDPFDPALKQYVIPAEYKINSDQISPEILKLQDQICEDLIPIEIKITKTKDAGKDEMRYLLFCKQNLRMYNDLGEYIADLPKLEHGSKRLAQDVNMLTNMAVSSVSEDFADDSEQSDLDFDAPFLS